MAVSIKTAPEIEKMRVAGRLAAEVLEMIGPHVVPGITTAELDRICHNYIVGTQARSRHHSITGVFRSRSAPRSTSRSATAFRVRNVSRPATC